jgi:hypothetical protein
MKVRCLRDRLDESEAERLGGPWRVTGKVLAKPGQVYPVYGLYTSQGEPFIDLRSESGYIVPSPLCLFEVTDGRVHPSWELHNNRDGITLWPPSFYREYYLDDLIEGVPEVVEEFRKVRAEIEPEADGTYPGRG